MTGLVRVGPVLGYLGSSWPPGDLGGRGAVPGLVVGQWSNRGRILRRRGLAHGSEEEQRMTIPGMLDGRGTTAGRLDGKGARILAKSLFKELRGNGYSADQILALTTELIGLVSQTVAQRRHRR